MSLPELKLDDRRFQNIVDETKERIAHYCKEWTDHNVSDPGVTLIELFAWMTDILIYRMNKVPDLHYIKFMEMLGLKLGAPEAAQTRMTFWLSAPQINPLRISAGTAVSTTQTETRRPVVFTTDNDFMVQPPDLQAIVLRNGGNDGNSRYRPQNLQRLKTGFDGVDVFTTPSPNQRTPTPQVDDALYFGFANDLSHHILRLELEFQDAYGAGINPNFPPYEWQVSTGNEHHPWALCELDLDPVRQAPLDTTRGMNSAGRIQLHLPTMGKANIEQQELFWVRVRVKEISAEERERGMKPYDRSPRLRRLQSVATMGGTTAATHAQSVTQETLGHSDATPGQRFQLQATPILAPRKAHERLRIKVEGQADQFWTEVPDFADSSAYDRHYTLDSVTGELRLGPAVRQPNGEIKLYGKVPEKGATLIFDQYRYGGGVEGNVDPGALNTLKTAIPYVDRVANRQPARSGLDAETLQAAMMRAPHLLRSRERAVTAEDYEFLARTALPTAVGRVKCIQPTPDDGGRVVPGQVYVLLVPYLDYPERESYLTRADLTPDPEAVAQVYSYLDKRRLLTTRLVVSAPAYQWVAVVVALRQAPGVEQRVVEMEVQRRLYRFLNPLTGGIDSKGWPFGRSLYASDVYQCLQGTPHVLFVRSLALYAAAEDGQPQGEPVEVIDLVAHGVIASGLHTVEFV